MVTSLRGRSGVHGLDGGARERPGRLGFVQLQLLRTSSRVKGGGGGASWNPASLPTLHFWDSWLPDHTVALVLGWPLATLTWTLRAGSAGAGPWEQRPHPPTGGECVPESRTCRRPQRPRGRLWGGAGAVKFGSGEAVCFVTFGSRALLLIWVSCAPDPTSAPSLPPSDSRG